MEKVESHLMYCFAHQEIVIMREHAGWLSLHEMTCIRGYNESVYVMCTERYTGVY